MNNQEHSPPNKLMKISEFAKETQHSPRALRFYEQQGILTPTIRSKGGFRFYANTQRSRIEYIQKLKDLGCSLSEIQSLIQNWSQQPTAAEGMKALEEAYQQKLISVQAAINKLREVERELEESITFIQGCYECPKESPPVVSCSECNRPLHENLTLIRGITERSK